MLSMSLIAMLLGMYVPALHLTGFEQNLLNIFSGQDPREVKIVT